MMPSCRSCVICSSAARALSCAAIIVRPRAVSRKLCDSGPNSSPMSTMVIAMTTSISTSVKARRTLVITEHSSGPAIAADERLEVQSPPAVAFPPEGAGANAHAAHAGDADRTGDEVAARRAVDLDPPVWVPRLIGELVLRAGGEL